MCGEHHGLTGASQGQAGSSPHVRGALLFVRQRNVFIGIIPACAGSTDSTPYVRCCHWDHPRMCGEHSIIFFLRLPVKGSSPHVRGARNTSQAPANRYGIIPACAGSTASMALELMAWRDHPRMCGEHCVSRGVMRGSSGSSPHVRGARRDYPPRPVAPGIIPACAGSTIGLRTGQLQPRDHPRMCGEHKAEFSMILGGLGSSPHVRGAQPSRAVARLAAGIIPACAGSTFVFVFCVFWVWDHPRMCGEHDFGRETAIVRQGSSPHVRGAHLHDRPRTARLGIIPACAGSTVPNRSRCSRPWDHPRMCGEH